MSIGTNLLQTVMVCLLLLFACASATAQDTLKPKPVAKKWFETINLRGYMQVRYNRLAETNPKLKCEQCDRSWGETGGIFFRRIRLIFSGNLSERVYFYLQPDLASSASATSLHFAQIRDAYFDLSLDKKKEYRFRFGQSKVPFGFENMQSSQNRLALDRNDALNSAVSNERDMSAFFYYAPAKIRDRFAKLVGDGLKGSGDYGVIGFGVFNGQTANRPEGNDGLHVIGRVSYPFELKNGQIIEAGVQAYTGKVVVSTLTKGVIGINSLYEYKDERVAASISVYPQPFGFQAEYNVGTGPEYNPVNNTIEQKTLKGGYALLSYKIDTKNHQTILPFVRYQTYEGGKKQELDARKHRVKETEIGVEWQPFKNFEAVVMYTISDRTAEDGVLKTNQQQGNLLRLQLQLNF